jgi:hypothetical protein
MKSPESFMLKFIPAVHFLPSSSVEFQVRDEAANLSNIVSSKSGRDRTETSMVGESKWSNSGGEEVKNVKFTVYQSVLYF